MVRLLLILILAIHGLIHLLGFAKEWNFLPVEQLTGKTLFPLSPGAARALGVFWVVAFLAFAVAAAAFLLRREWWWMAGLGAIVVSQILITVYWKDARAGTIANLIVLPVVIVSWATWSFDAMVRREAGALLASSMLSRTDVVTGEMANGLPLPVSRWLHRTNVIGREAVRSVRLRQKGEMRTKPDVSWMPFEAEQYFSVEPAAFVWKARLEVAPLTHMIARDKLADGKGNMLIKLMSLYTVADGKGTEMDQGTVVRYLAETVWFPSSALSSYIRWEGVDSVSARATISLGGTTVSGLFTFNEQGDPVGFEAQRYGEFDGKFSKETWLIAMKEYKVFGGVRIPNISEVTWKLRSGDFTWFRLEITDLEFNKPEVY